MARDVSLAMTRNIGIMAAADTAGLALQRGHDVLESLLEHLQGIVAGLFLYDIESLVNDLLSDTLLAVQHNAVHQTGDHFGIVNRICQDIALGNVTSSRHLSSLLHRMISSVLESIKTPVVPQRALFGVRFVQRMPSIKSL